VAVSMRIFRAIGLWTPAGGEYFTPEQMWHALGVGRKFLFIVAYFISLGPFYFTMFQASPWQATIGQRLLNIYVTDNTGGRIGLARAGIRWFSMLILNWLVLWLVSFVTILATKNKKALHDMAAGTLMRVGQCATDEPLEGWRVFTAFGVPYLWLIVTFLYTIL